MSKRFVPGSGVAVCARCPSGKRHEELTVDAVHTWTVPIVAWRIDGTYPVPILLDGTGSDDEAIVAVEFEGRFILTGRTNCGESRSSIKELKALALSDLFMREQSEEPVFDGEVDGTPEWGYSSDGEKTLTFNMRRGSKRSKVVFYDSKPHKLTGFLADLGLGHLPVREALAAAAGRKVFRRT